MDVHPTKNVSIGIDPYPDDKKKPSHFWWSNPRAQLVQAWTIAGSFSSVPQPLNHSSLAAGDYVGIFFSDPSIQNEDMMGNLSNINHLTSTY